MTMSLSSFANSTIDSLRVEKVKGKKYIIHRAEPKETLYSITRRYSVTLEDLYEFNPSLKEHGLKMYDTIYVPLSKKKKKQKPNVEPNNISNFHIVQAGETLFAISKQYNLTIDSLVNINNLKNAHLDVGDTLFIMQRQKKEPIYDPGIKYHVVKPSETLFGISRLYQVEIEDLQQWNNLPDYTLSIGQRLIVSGETNATEVVEDTVVITPIVQKGFDSTLIKPKKPVLDTLFVKTDNSQFKTKTKEVEGKKQTVEEGFAMKIEDTDYTKKYLALHRSAPLGSTIQVKNQMTDKVIEARVVGKLPESAMNRKLLLRLSSAAYKAMGAIDLKTPIIVSYSSDAE